MKTSFVKVLSILLFGILSVFANPSFAQRKSSSDVYVKSYVKSNGTVVEGHMRSAPDKTAGNNFSTKGNVNPYTGAAGTVVVPGGVGTTVDSALMDSSPAKTKTVDLSMRIDAIESKIDALTKKVDVVIANLAPSLSNKPGKTTVPSKKSTLPMKPTATKSSTKPRSSDKSSLLLSWRKLRRGMTYSNVRLIMGEPTKIVAGEFSYWTYKHGILTFCLDKLDAWNEPDL
jgi:hypothetical protein